VKIRGVLGEIGYELMHFTYDRTSEIHYMAVLCVAAEHGGLIKKKRIKESLWVKLKAPKIREKIYADTCGRARARATVRVT